MGIMVYSIWLKKRRSFGSMLFLVMLPVSDSGSEIKGFRV